MTFFPVLSDIHSHDELTGVSRERGFVSEDLKLTLHAERVPSESSPLQTSLSGFRETSLSYNVG